MSLGKTVRSYVWWTHERGSVHYDVMVTLILAFIFLTPRFVHYGDQPKPDWPADEIRVAVNPAGGLVCDVPTALLHGEGDSPTDRQLVDAIVPVAGPVTVDRREPMHEVGGRIMAWRVWVHR